MTTNNDDSIFYKAVQRRQQLANRLDKGDWQDPIYRVLPKLADVKDGRLVYDAEPDGTPAVTNGAEMTAKFLISTMRKDRHGDIVVPQGCKRTLGDYEKNPVVFFGHKSNSLPIASSTGIEVRDDFGIYATAKFHGKSQESEDVYRLVECGELRCASIGFFPTLGEELEPEDDSQLKKDQILFQPWFALKFLEWNLLEWSVVAVPANADCLALRMAKGFGGRQLAPGVREALAPFAAPRKSWATGFVPEPEAPVVAAVKSEPAPELVPVPEPVTLSPDSLGVCREASDFLVECQKAAWVPRTHQIAMAHHARALSGVSPATTEIKAELVPNPASEITPAVLQAVSEVLALQAENARRLKSMTGKVD